MPEYGMAIIVRGPRSLSLEEIDRAWYLVRKNYQLTRLGHPEYRLREDQVEVRLGPVTEARLAGEACSVCGGGEDNDCVFCNNSGWVPGPVIPGLYDHNFAWYANVEDETHA